MFWIILMGFLAEDHSIWHIRNTEIFKPLRSGQGQVTANGDLFLIDYDESQIRQYGLDGQLKLRIGRKGSGPGEFNFLADLFVVGNDLFVADFNGGIRFHQFDLGGRYLKSHRPPMGTTPVKGGWLITSWNWGIDSVVTDPGRLVFQTLEGKGKEILNLRPQGFVPPKANNEILKAGSDGKIRIPFNPAPSLPKLVVAPDGLWGAIKPGSLKGKLVIVDLVKGEVSKTLDLDQDPLPFNKLWGEKLLTQKNKRPQRRRVKVVHEAKFPDFFPVIRTLRVFADGLLYVEHWTHNPDKTRDLRAYDLNGGERQVPFEAASMERILAFREGMCWVTSFIEEEVGIAYMPVAKVDAFVAAHPIEPMERNPIVD